MSEELDSFQLRGDRTLPNATAVLVLGILSLVTCVFYGIIGIILGIIALVLHKKDKALYESDPIAFEKSFKNSKAGNVCAIIGLILSSLYFLFFVVIILGAILS